MSQSDEFGVSAEEEALFATAADNVSSKRASENHFNGPTLKKQRTQSDNATAASLANRVLRERFGLHSFRSNQEAVILRILSGESACVVLPTGGGKSLCYQIPAVIFKELDEVLGSRPDGRSGLTVVISPLIALMKDQVDALLRRNIRAAVLDSTIDRDAFVAIHDDLSSGKLDLLYCAPERLNMEGFVESLKAAPGGIRLLAVDEAHCISEWGHSFRPDYLKVARFAQEAKVESVICLTATATPKVAQDICDTFAIPTDGLFTTTVYRPNLRLLARYTTKGGEEIDFLTNFLQEHPGPTIVYVATHNTAEKLADSLEQQGVDAIAYHAGMKSELRSRTQDKFLQSKDLVIVATIAFGMGIDKPDIRNIIHYDIPSSIEAYSQQIGRAGRDGIPSVCLLNLSHKDFHLQNIFTYGDRPSRRSLRLLLKDIFGPERATLRPGDQLKVSLYHQANDFDISKTMLSIVYAQLELHYGLFRSSGFSYSEYKYVPVKSNRIEDDNSPEAVAIVKASKGGGKWKTIDLGLLAATSGVPRIDLVRKIDAWSERGYIELKKSGVQNLFKILKPLLIPQEEIDKIEEQLDAGMGTREAQALDRTRELVRLITGKKCFSGALASYFGETSLKECGHCTWCETHEQVVLPAESPLPPNQTRIQRVLRACAARDDPRFLARIAFGIKSPRVRLMKMDRSAAFECMEKCDFPEILRVFTEECARESDDEDSI